MSWKLIAPVFTVVALALSVPAYAGNCDGLEGKELKKCEKKAKAQAKQDGRSEPYVPSALDSSLSGWDGENNPFATDAYRVRKTESGIQNVDDYLGRAFRIQATVVFAKYLVDEVGNGNTEALKAVPTLVPLVEAAVKDGKGLVEEGQGIASGLPGQLAGPQAMKLPKVTAALKDGIGALTSAVDMAPDVAKSLGNVAKNPCAAAGAAAGAATDEATKAAGDAVEDVTGGE